MAGKGGARPGAGRKPKAKKYESLINQAEQRVADKLPEILDNLFKLADGGQELVQEEWQPAGIIMVGEGENAKRAFPDLDADKLVLVRRTVTKAGMDRAANTYLVDRVMGKAVQRSEISGLNGEQLNIVVTHARHKPNDS